MKIVKKKTVLLPKESYWYLRNKMHEQRSETGKPLNKEKVLERVFRETNPKTCKYEPVDFVQIGDRDLGGCIGNPLHAYEQGRWTSWSVDDMKQMLNEVGLPYKDGDEIEVICV